MNLEIFLTPEAKGTLYAIIIFVRQKWGEKTAAQLKASIVKTLKRIGELPYLYNASELDPSIRKGHINKYVSVIYEVTETQVVVLYFWDNRQDPII